MTVENLYACVAQCSGVTTDSRNCPENSIFFALKGDTFDGNHYATQALEQGCRFAVTDNSQYAVDDRYLLVDNVLESLQQVARHHRRQFNIPVIGITGTNGKTTTKELVAAVLSKKYTTLFTQGNFNNHIGVPLTLLQLQPEHQMAVIEMGANHPGEIATLCAIAEPDFGIITNVGKAHLEGFGSFEGVMKTKAELYDFIHYNDFYHKKGGKVFINQDNNYLLAMAEKAGLTERFLQNYSLKNEDSYVFGKITGSSPFLALGWHEKAKKEMHSITTHLIGTYNAENVLAAVAIGVYFGVEATDIDDAIRNYMPANNRSQFKQTAHNQLIIDAYNANPTSMTASLANFVDMKADKKAVIIGDMFELDTSAGEEHRKTVEQIKQSSFDKVMLVGEQFSKIPSDFEKFPDTPALIEYLTANKLEGYTILIKGSHGMRLDKCVALL